jgi:hypothetical protein
LLFSDWRGANSHYSSKQISACRLKRFSDQDKEQVIKWFYQVVSGRSMQMDFSGVKKFLTKTVFFGNFFCSSAGSRFLANSVRMRAADRKSRKILHSVFQLKEIPD